VEEMAVKGDAALTVAVVNRVRVAEEGEAGDPVDLALVAAHRLGEPAERARTQAAEDDARVIGLAQDRVDPVRPPDGQQADQAATAHIDHVLGEQVSADVADAPLAAEETEVRWLGSVAEGVVKADDVVVSVPAGCRQEADLREGAARQAE